MTFEEDKEMFCSVLLNKCKKRRYSVLKLVKKMVEIFHVFGAYSDSSLTTSVIKTTTETWRSERKPNVASSEECQKKRRKKGDLLCTALSFQCVQIQTLIVQECEHVFSTEP